MRGNTSEENCQRVAKSLHKTKLIVEGAEGAERSLKTSSCSVPSSYEDCRVIERGISQGINIL